MTGEVSLKKIANNYMGSRGAAFMLKNRAGAEAIVTQTGARLFSLRLAGREVLFNNPDMLTRLPELIARYHAAGCKREGVLDWPDLNGTGGEKTLFAPQMPGVPHPVPNIGPFEFVILQDGKGIQLTSMICPETGLQVIREIRVSESDDSFVVSAHLKYHGTDQGADSPLIQVAPWSVMQLLMPANVNLHNLAGKPQAFDVPGVFMSQAELDQSQLIKSQGHGSFIVGLTPNLPQMAKIGYNYKGGNGPEQVMIHFPHREIELFLTSLLAGGTNYPHGYQAETFWCGNYFEQEVLNPVQQLARGDSTDPLTFRIALRVASGA